MLDFIDFFFKINIAMILPIRPNIPTMLVNTPFIQKFVVSISIFRFQTYFSPIKGHEISQAFFLELHCPKSTRKTKAKLLCPSSSFLLTWYIQVQNDHWVLSRLVPCLNCTVLAYSVLHGHFGQAYYLR